MGIFFFFEVDEIYALSDYFSPSLFLSGLLCFIFETKFCHVAQANFVLVNLLLWTLEC